MKRICKLSALAFALFTINMVPELAAAQDVRGTFTLAHTVHWQEAVVPAGTYRFSIVSKGPDEMLVLSRTDGAPAGFMIFTADAEVAEPGQGNRIILGNHQRASYVEAMELPEFGVTLRFAVPDELRVVAQPSTSGSTPAAK